ncbi:MAG: isoprenylcysteine carboxylmethyltransferase family protein [Verrucomicrobiae bacterium]|nr:isoprenylcysteine carboxylmethyltransferase family protein [Verrucomicrobiae bacterium]
MTRSARSKILVALQWIAMLGLAGTGAVVPTNLPLATLQLAAFALMFWTFALLGIGRFNVSPEVNARARLVVRGPYRVVRHPMYVSVFALMLAWLLGRFTWTGLACGITLVVIALQKMTLEEEALAVRFPEYEGYLRHTARLIPGIW